MDATRGVHRSVYCPDGGLAGLPSRPAVCTAESPASARGLHRALLGGGPDLFGAGAGGRVAGGALHDEGGAVQGDPEQAVEGVRHPPAGCTGFAAARIGAAACPGPAVRPWVVRGW